MANMLAPFSLADMAGGNVTFPTGSATPTVLCFVKEDCPTCNLVMPLLQALHDSGDVAVLAPGQTAEGNRELVARHKLTLPLLDDSILKVSFAYDVETVPLVLLADGDGAEIDRLVGFDRAEWQAFFAAPCPQCRARLAGVAEVAARLRIAHPRSHHRRTSAGGI